MNEHGRAQALALMSGGLDSQLAVCVLKAQGVPVKAISYESPFFSADNARKACARLEVPLTVLTFTEDILEILREPKHGFGGCLNPCIDCHARMLKRAGALLGTLECDFLVTGEVLNERPMSQTRRSLGIVARESGYPDLVLRPLSAGHLDETEPERRGWVNRHQLLSLEGRSRKPQFKLAEQFELGDYPTPAGGCLLTDPNFCKRLQDLRDIGGVTPRNAYLLQLGRHFKIAPDYRAVVGRNEGENHRLRENAAPDDIYLRCCSKPGPAALLPGTATPEQIQRTAALCARYCNQDQPAPVEIEFLRGGRATRALVPPMDPAEAEALRVK